MNDYNEEALCMSFDNEVSCNQSDQSISETMTNIRPSKVKRDEFDKMSCITFEKAPSEQQTVKVQPKVLNDASVETCNRTRQKQFQEDSASDKDYQPKPPIRFISNWNIEVSNNKNTRSKSDTAVVKDTSNHRLEESGVRLPALSEEKKERRQIAKASEDDSKVRRRSTECDTPSKQSKTGKVEKVSKERRRKSHSGDDNNDQLRGLKVVRGEKKLTADNESKKEKRKEGKSRSSTKITSHKSRNDTLFDDEVSTFLELLECTSSESGAENVKIISTVKENLEHSKKNKKDDNKIKHSTKGSSYSSPRKRQGEAAVERDLSNFLHLLETSAAGVTSMEVLNPSAVEESSEPKKDEKKKVNGNHSSNKKKSCSDDGTKQSAGRSQSKSSDRLDLQLGTTDSHDNSPRQGDKISSKNDKKRESSKKSKDVLKDASPKQSKSENQDTLKTPLGKKSGISSLNNFMTSNKHNEISVVSDEQSVRSRRSNLAAWREMTKSRSETDGVRISATMRGGKKEKIEKKDDKDNDDDDDNNSGSNNDDDDDNDDANAETDDMNESVLKDDERKRILNESMKRPVRAMSIRTASTEVSTTNNTASLLAGLPSEDDMDDDSSRGGYLPTGFGKCGGIVGQQQSFATSSDKDRASARRPSLLCAASFSDFSESSENNNNDSISSFRGMNAAKLNSSFSNDQSLSRTYSPEKLLRNSLVKDKSTATILASFSPTKTSKGTCIGSPSKLSTRMGTTENDDALQNILKSRRLRGDDVANHRAVRNEENTKRKSKKFSFV